MADRTADFFKGLIIGGAVGAVFALLYAPKSGEETRQDLGKRAEELYGKAREEYDETLEKAKQSYAEALTRLRELEKEARRKTEEMEALVSDLVNKGRTNIDESRERFRKAVEAGKEAYSEEKKKKA